MIHAEALRRVTLKSARSRSYLPASINSNQLQADASRFGPQVYLAPPAYIEHLFRGITFSVYQTIESLYCSKLMRSMRTVYLLLEALARAAEATPIEEEAVWAICTFLEARRTKSTAVTLVHSNSTWVIVRIVCPASFSTMLCEEQPCAFLVMDAEDGRLLALRWGKHKADGEDTLTILRQYALYDALTLERRPAASGASGLCWYVPQRIMIDGTLAEESQLECHALGMVVEQMSEVPQCINELRERWKHVQSSLTLTNDTWGEVFDRFLHASYGTSPLRVQEEQMHAFGHLTGYAQDPADVFPALRALLPVHHTAIGQDGSILFDGLHYADDILSLWPQTTVTIRQSLHTEAKLWVYREGEILCQAMARELRRRDGSYRAFRVRR